MDPNETFRQLLEAIARGDTTEANDLAFNLAAWIGRDGFPPKSLDTARVVATWGDRAQDAKNVLALQSRLEATADSRYTGKDARGDLRCAMAYLAELEGLYRGER